MRALLATGEEPRQARRVLVRMSRDRGRIDMAGRWGIAIEGLTTQDERRALVGAVRASGSSETALRMLSLMRWDESLTPEAREVIELARQRQQLVAAAHQP